MDDLCILHWTPRWHVWHGHNNQNVPCQCRCSSFFLFFPPPWISLNCIVRWIHVSEPGPTVTSCLLQSVCLKKKKKKKKNGEQKIDSAWIWNIKNVAFSVKTACTLFIVCDGACPVRPPVGLQGCCIVCCSIADVNSVWGLDLQQTGRQSLSSQQPTSLSATLAVTKSIMFSLLCHFQHHRGFVDFSLLSFLPWFFFPPSIFYSSPWSWMVSSVRATCQAKREGLPIRKPRVRPSSVLGEKGIVVLRGGERWETVIAMSLPVSTRRQSIPQCCSCPWPSCYGCSWHTPRDSSRSPPSVVVSCEQTFW